MPAPDFPTERACAAALALTEGIGWALLGRLLARFGSATAVLAAAPSALQSVRGIGPGLAARLRAADPARIAARLEAFAANGMSILLWSDADYPAAFRALPDRPLILFYRGLPLPAALGPERAVAIVGTRRPTPESLALAEGWAAGLAARGWCVVSGLARGIDSTAHRGALWGASGTREEGANRAAATLAVLGSGLNRVYPPENAALAQRIAARGGLLSEMCPDSPPSRESLVLRNRLIAALSRALIVIEAPRGSGALHAARRARAQGKPVFAIDNSAGNADLLRDFAHPLPNLPDSAETLIERIAWAEQAERAERAEPMTPAAPQPDSLPSSGPDRPDPLNQLPLF